MHLPPRGHHAQGPCRGDTGALKGQTRLPVHLAAAKYPPVHSLCGMSLEQTCLVFLPSPDSLVRKELCSHCTRGN